MKSIATVLFGAWAVLVLTLPAFAAEPSSACHAKRRNIEAQLTNATENGRKQEAAGLRKALRANEANCTDEWLDKEHRRKILEARQKVAEREARLREAEQKGDPKKVAERQARLEAARRELSEAEQPLER